MIFARNAALVAAAVAFFGLTNISVSFAQNAFQPGDAVEAFNAATRKWVRAYVERYRRLPDEARLSWPYPFVEDLLGTARPLTSQIEMFA